MGNPNYYLLCFKICFIYYFYLMCLPYKVFRQSLQNRKTSKVYILNGRYTKHNETVGAT